MPALKASRSTTAASARARAGFARGHLIDVVLHIPGGKGHEAEQRAAPRVPAKQRVGQEQQDHRPVVPRPGARSPEPVVGQGENEDESDELALEYGVTSLEDAYLGLVGRKELSRAHIVADAP